MKILKFGGTSLGKPERMHSVSELVTKTNEPKIVVLSAVSGTTNALVDIGESLRLKQMADALDKVDALYGEYVKYLSGLYTKESALEKSQEIIEKQFGIIRSLLEKAYTDKEERILLAQGELISTQLFQTYLEEQGISSSLLNALDFMRIDENNEPDLLQIETRLKKILADKKDIDLFVTQGYICRNTFDEIDNLKRGGSDYTASLIGAAVKADEIQIWTDISGMHNNDPRVVKNTYPIAELNFDEAAELAYFGAKILHPYSIRPAKDRNIPVKLLNTMEPDAAGTTISNVTGSREIKAIAAKDNITAIKIKSGRMLLAYGFLRRIFEIFEKYKTPIDMITTSEVAVSLTIDDDTYLENIRKELEVFGYVEIDRHQTIICVVGASIAEKNGLAALVFDSMKEVPVRMISFGGSKNNISLVVNTNDKKAALMALNEGLFSLAVN